MGLSLVDPAFVTTPTDSLWNRAGAYPTLDLPFSRNKSLTDAVSGQNLITFTRASSGTYVGSDGLIKTATTNLLLRSEEFDNAAWVKTRTSVTANAIVAPDGSLTADRINEDTTATSTHLVAQTGALITSVGTRYAYSVYAKADGRDWLIVSPGGTWGYAWFNVSNGTLGTIVDGGGATTASITETGNGWYRCIVSATAVEARGLQLLLSTSNNIITYTGNGSSGIYLWGAQLEQSSTVGEYIPTTSMINSAPRFDHNPTTGESLGLLVEEQRTNLLLQSEEFDNASWVKLGSVVSANAIASPSGAITADLLREDAFTSIHEIYRSNTGGAATYALSVFFKNGSGTRHLNLGASRGASDWISCRFNPVNGTASVVSIEGVSFTSASTQVISMGNGWYRGALTFTSSGVFSAQVALSSSSAAPPSGLFGVETYTGDGTSGIYIWGAQLEVGSGPPTSYIPTTDAAATRAADVASITGSAFSSWYRQDEGTAFAAFRDLGAGLNRSPYMINDGTTNNRIGLFNNFTTNVNHRVRTGGASADPGNLLLTVGVLNRHAIAVKAETGGAAAACNGTLSTTASPASPPVVNQLAIGSFTGSIDFNNAPISRLCYWPQRLPNATLQAITL